MRSRTCLILVACLGVAAGGLAGWWYLHISSLEYRLRHAQEAIRAGRYTAGEAEAAALLADGHKDAALLLRGESLLLRGEAQDRREDLAAALSTLNQIHAEGNLLVEAASLSGRCLLRLGNLLEAERAFVFVVSENPEFVDAHRGLMAVYYDLGALTAAMQHAETWAELAPRDGRPHRFMGLLYKDMGNYKEAVEPYRAALDRDLKDPVREEVKVELADCLMRVLDYGAAYATLASCRPTEDALVRILTAQAQCKRALGKPEDARELVENALEANPGYTTALRLRAQLALDANEPARAVNDLERAAALSPNEYDTQHMLGRVYGQLGNQSKAQAARERVTEIQGRLDLLTKLTRDTIERPKDAKLHRQLADLYGQMGMPEMASAQRRVAGALADSVPAGHATLSPP
jgi:tetratricopeptide (TPR) repeat protein